MEHSYFISKNENTETQKKVKFELRTKFFLRKQDGDEEELVSESLPFSLTATQSLKQIAYRLQEYSMPGDQIQRLVHEALNFDSSVPILINVKVSTLQLGGETIDDAKDRSVRPDCLAPSELVRTIEKKDKKIRRRRLHNFLLYDLPRERWDILDGFDCSICLDGPTAAAPVSSLPCGHAHHRHCLVRWLMTSETCPMCRYNKIIPSKKGGGTNEGLIKELDTSRVNRSTNRHLRVRRRPTRVRRAPAWHHDFVVGSTSHLPDPPRVRRAPAWLNDYVMMVGVRG